MTSVVINRLAKSHAGTTIIAALDLTIASGEVVSILGPSGCGKTTLLRCLAGLEAVDGGSVAIGDRVVASGSAWVPPERRNIGLVFQSYALWPHLTVFGNVALGLKIRKIDKAQIRARVEAALARLELGGLADRYPSQLSGGQQQRVALARAIVLEPQVLLFDEPLSNLDARIREHVRGELNDLVRKLGITTVYVTHDKAEAMAISDRIVVMNKGAIAQVGTGHDIYQRPASLFVADFIGRCNLLPVRPFDGPEGAAPIVVGGRRLKLAARGERPVGVVAFRPDDIHAGPAPDTGATQFTAAVARQVYFGTNVEIDALVDGHAVTLNTAREVPAGELKFSVPADHLLFFPEEEAGTSAHAAAQ